MTTAPRPRFLARPFAEVQRRHDRLAPMTRGIIGILVAMFLFTCMDVIAKTLLTRYPTPQVVWARYAGQTLLMLIVFLPSIGRRLRTRHLSLQLLRSTLLFGATCFFFTSLNFLGLAETVALFEIAPLLITLMGALVLGEQVGLRRWIAVVVGLIGALIILRPGFDVFQPAALLPMIAATCMAAYQIATRYLGAAEPIWTTMLYTAGVGTLLATPVMPFVWQSPSLSDAAIFATFGWIGFVGHLCLVYALGQAPASALAPFNYAGFVWATLLGFIWFAELPDGVTFLGAGIIVAAGLYVWHRERVGAAG
ncbi:MAG: DMT family transporter [Pseudomonadota bacterium]